MTRAWDELQQISAAAAELYRHNPITGAAAMAIGLPMAQQQRLIELWRREPALNPALTVDIDNCSEQLQTQKDPCS